ncbi:MAG TPA: ABC transporter ATP-binding protein [Bacillota bacterium]|nr:ABC transporter ATP-binding protein [Bacillota bacterium]
MDTRQLQRDTSLPTFRRGLGANRFRPAERPRDTKRTVRRIIKVYMRQKIALFLAVLLTSATSAISVSIPYFVGKAYNAFDIVTGKLDHPLLFRFLLIIGLLYLSNWIINTTEGVLMLRVSQLLVRTLRKEFFDKLQKLPLKFYDTRPHGDTMSRVTNDVESISSTIAQATTQFISSIITFTGSLVLMLSLSVPLTAVTLICVPLIIGLTVFIAKNSRPHFIGQSRNLGALGGLIEETIMGMRTVKAFGQKRRILSEFSEINADLTRDSYMAQVWSGLMMPMFNVINNLTFTLVALTGGLLAAGNGLPVGTVVSFLNYSKQIGRPLNNVAGMFNTVLSALAGAERVFEVMDTEEEAPDRENAVEPGPSISGEVEFDHVTFGYTPDNPVLHDICFKVEPGQTIALVGETGSGKTTIVNLLTRFYDVDSGSVKVDGIDVRDYKRDSLRRLFSVVLQDTCLFSGTIMDNIRYSRVTATDDEVVAAARMAHADEFITRLPDGYGTFISGSTDTLSEGQKQLLAIARAVLSGSPILILDEATSSVDTKTEKDIQRALTRLMERRTSFLIAHRLSTIRDADVILVIKDGRIVERGSHAELMAKRGLYYSMAKSQGVTEDSA